MQPGPQVCLLASLVLLSMGCLQSGPPGPSSQASFCGAEITWSPEGLFEATLEDLDKPSAQVEHDAPAKGLPIDEADMRQAGVPNAERFELTGIWHGPFQLAASRGGEDEYRFRAETNGDVQEEQREGFEAFLSNLTSLGPDEIVHKQQAFFEREVWTGESASQEEPIRIFEMRTFGPFATDTLFGKLDPQPGNQTEKIVQTDTYLEADGWTFKLEGPEVSVPHRPRRLAPARHSPRRGRARDGGGCAGSSRRAARAGQPSPQDARPARSRSPRRQLPRLMREAR